MTSTNARASAPALARVIRHGTSMPRHPDTILRFAAQALTALSASSDTTHALAGHRHTDPAMQ